MMSKVLKCPECGMEVTAEGEGSTFCHGQWDWTDEGEPHPMTEMAVKGGSRQ